MRPSNRPGGRVRILVAAAVAGGVAVFAFTGAGIAMMAAVFGFLAFYAGVFSLVALSLTVMAGLAATDRLVLMVRHRILMQGVHRATATIAMVFLTVHVLTKIVQGHATVLDVIVPFLASHRTIYVGLGTIAGYLMIAIAVTGVMRARFAGSAHPWRWRTLHATAYLCWPIALLHGLNAGRPAKSWVTVSYALCLILVGLALLIRLRVIWSAQLSAARTRTAAQHSASQHSTVVNATPSSIPPLLPRQTPPATQPPPQPARQSQHPEPSDVTTPAWAKPSVVTRLVVPASSADFDAADFDAADFDAAFTEFARRAPAADEGPPPPKPIGRWTNANTDTITDEEFWSYLRDELQR